MLAGRLDILEVVVHFLLSSKGLLLKEQLLQIFTKQDRKKGWMEEAEEEKAAEDWKNGPSRRRIEKTKEKKKRNPLMERMQVRMSNVVYLQTLKKKRERESRDWFLKP